MLINYRTPPTTRFQSQDGGLSFYNKGDPAQTGRGRCGGRYGRGGRGGRGRGRDTSGDVSNLQTADAHVAEETTPASNEIAQTSGVYSLALPAKWLLLDSCSLSDLIAKEELLTNIHQGDHPLNVRCNAGSIVVKDKGLLGSYPEAVWHNKNGVANILWMHNASKHFRITMDTDVEDAICLHKPDGNVMKFTPSEKGLYKHALEEEKDGDNGWAMITTVKEQAARYTKRAYNQAQVARKFQNILMRLGSRELMDVAIKHLRDCPVTRADIQAADDIFGQNLGSLKGKTPTRPNKHVRGGTDGVPPQIMALHGRVILAIDIMFVNSIPFLMTTSRNLHFGTMEGLPNRQIPTIKDKLLLRCR